MNISTIMGRIEQNTVLSFDEMTFYVIMDCYNEYKVQYIICLIIKGRRCSFEY